MSAPTPPPELRERFARAGGKPTYVRGMFGRIAGVYDLMNRVMTGGLDGRWRAFAARLLALPQGARVLDIGTGTGDLAITVARQYPTAHVVGIDFTPEMLTVGREKVHKLGLDTRIELQQEDGEHLSAGDASFDACCSAFVVRNMTDPEAGFREMARVVRPGGRVVCLEISHPHNSVLAAGYHLYFNRLVPWIGSLVGRSFDAYSYLPTSVGSFPDAPRLAAIMAHAGLADVHYFGLFGGVVAVHVGTRLP
jgi:demethylmenaquinone methyltransferase / 2-methoxy-6-polyprenyl-1,4-benzoquinol methylase